MDFSEQNYHVKSVQPVVEFLQSEYRMQAIEFRVNGSVVTPTEGQDGSKVLEISPGANTISVKVPNKFVGWTESTNPGESGAGSSMVYDLDNSVGGIGTTPADNMAVIAFNVTMWTSGTFVYGVHYGSTAENVMNGLLEGNITLVLIKSKGGGGVQASIPTIAFADVSGLEYMSTQYAHNIRTNLDVSNGPIQPQSARFSLVDGTGAILAYSMSAVNSNAGARISPLFSVDAEKEVFGTPLTVQVVDDTYGYNATTPTPLTLSTGGIARSSNVLPPKLNKPPVHAPGYVVDTTAIFPLDDTYGKIPSRYLVRSNLDSSGIWVDASGQDPSGTPIPANFGHLTVDVSGLYWVNLRAQYDTMSNGTTVIVGAPPTPTSADVSIVTINAGDVKGSTTYISYLYPALASIPGGRVAKADIPRLHVYDSSGTLASATSPGETTVSISHATVSNGIRIIAGDARALGQTFGTSEISALIEVPAVAAAPSLSTLTTTLLTSGSREALKAQIQGLAEVFASPVATISANSLGFMNALMDQTTVPASISLSDFVANPITVVAFKSGGTVVLDTSTIASSVLYLPGNAGDSVTLMVDGTSHTVVFTKNGVSIATASNPAITYLPGTRVTLGNKTYTLLGIGSGLLGPDAATTGGGAVPCFLAGAPVLTPSGYRRIETLTEGDMVLTGDGRSVAIQRVKRTLVTAGAAVDPYVIPKGRYGAVRRLLISPNHKVQTADGMIEARALGLRQEEQSGHFVYYNLELPEWGRDTLVVAGVVCESLAPVRRVTMPFAAFKALLTAKYGASAATPAVLEKVLRTCRMLPDGSVEAPVMRKA